MAPLYLFLYMLGPAANAQFKEIGPPPFSPAVAHQRIRTLLDNVELSNRQKTLDTLNGLTPWFRDILDAELIAGWQRDGRDRLLPVMEPLANAHVATAVIEFSWRKRTEATLNPDYAPMLGHLMARYPESGKEFISDLLGPVTPELSPPQVEAVCRILLDLPELGEWHQNGLRILPRYRATAERLLMRDREGGDQEKSYRAQIWMAELRGETPGATNQPSVTRRRPVFSPAPDNGPGPLPGDRAILRPPSATPDPAPSQSRPAAAPDSAPPTPRVPPVQPPRASPVPVPPQPYNGALSGTLECTGGPIPQNAEYVFRNLPPVKIQLDYDKKVWEGRLTPGENQTQRLILKNISSGSQKRCVVHWSVVP
jgi:hypothetical protein